MTAVLRLLDPERQEAVAGGDIRPRRRRSPVRRRRPPPRCGMRSITARKQTRAVSSSKAAPDLSFGSAPRYRDVDELLIALSLRHRCGVAAHGYAARAGFNVQVGPADKLDAALRDQRADPRRSAPRARPPGDSRHPAPRISGVCASAGVAVELGHALGQLGQRVRQVVLVAAAALVQNRASGRRTRHRAVQALLGDAATAAPARRPRGLCVARWRGSWRSSARSARA